MPTVSVIITAHNYGRFVGQAVDSVLNQTYDDYEIIIVDDGSRDGTAEFLRRYSEFPNVSVITNIDAIGLAKSANLGIRASKGKYVIRLDADDYFDENILLLLVNILDRHPEYGMVYCDYYHVNRYGDVIDQVRQLKVNEEVHLLDRSALAAGALYRRSCYDSLGGYCEDLRHQEDYDFWIRFIDKYKVYNVQLPLMYYRRHNASMSTNIAKRMDARRYVKNKFVEAKRDLKGKSILCVLPMVRENRYCPGLPLKELAGRPMFEYIVDQANKVELFDRVIVDTEDADIAEAAKNYGVEVPFIRPRRLAKLNTSPQDHFLYLLKALHEFDGYKPDVILVASYNTPFVRVEHMEEAINSLAIFECDSVISVRPNLRFHWQPGAYGLEPVIYPRELVNEQKWTTYEESGGIYAFNSSNVSYGNFLGKRISFIEIDKVEGLRIESEIDHCVAGHLIRSDKIPGLFANNNIPIQQ